MSKEQQSFDYLKSYENSIFIVSTLIAAIKYKDYPLKDAIVKFMINQLTDREINKVYKSIKKYLDRTGKLDEEEFKNFILTTEE